MTACDLMQSPGWSKLEDDALESRRDLVRKLIRRVTMKPGSLGTEIDRSHRCRLLPGLVQPKREQDLVVASIECPISLKRRGVEMRWSSRMLLTGIARMLLLLGLNGGPGGCRTISVNQALTL